MAFTPSAWSTPRTNRPSSSSTGSRSSACSPSLWNEAVKINGADPDFHRRDLWKAIQSGNFPEWELQFQLFDQDFADSFDFDVLDPTKLIPEEILPPIPVGRLVLDRMPDNFFAETEQVAFMTQNVPPGIDFSNDPLLQGRNFSYLDTQLKRLGSPNFTHIPINAPKCPFAPFPAGWPYGDAQSRRPGELPAEFVGRRPAGIAAARLPLICRTTSRGQSAGCVPKALPITTARHGSSTSARRRRSKHHIAAALTFELSKVKTPVIRERMVVASAQHRRDAGQQGRRRRLGLKAMPKPADAAMPTRQDLEASPALSIIENGPQRFEGRKLGILVTDGTDAALFKALTDGARQGRRARFEIIAPKVGGAKASDGSWIEAHQMIDGGPSVLYDAVALLPAAGGDGRSAAGIDRARFRRRCFRPLQVHRLCRGGDCRCLQKAGIAEDDIDEGFIALASPKDAAGFIGKLGQLRVWGREPSVKMK